MQPYTINVSGSERHDGEKPYTYVLNAGSLPEAKAAAWLYHLWFAQSEQGLVAFDGTIPNQPNWWDAHAQNADVVVIDCPEFPCHLGTPSQCTDRCHRDATVEPTSCRCPFAWHWIYATPQTCLLVGAIDRLNELGYDLPTSPPEETTW
ncbi:hypothetical protein E1264_02575 [Actinomadura sp. KC216]|uniref:hypothetical protein n=1 Tax=Actinomadura sp. KC216 TaxID=2530370 RepID=UPI00104F1971|nr:hypothetical protein [Actinomadura sp. KC216]TDB91195.1 hypothetical protein E1264_02575 [Actinomadura sp. KC216]